MFMARTFFQFSIILFIVTLTLGLAACGGSDGSAQSDVVVADQQDDTPSPVVDVGVPLEQDPEFVKSILSASVSSQSKLFNPEAVIPPQCYTRTEGQFNPCLTCHQFTPKNEGWANRMDDGELQGDYGFSDVGVTNHWLNLFEDRRNRMAAITDSEISAYVNQDNYSALKLALEARNWQGWIPDLENLHLGAEAFDDMGFAKDGSDWVAFNYMPLPSTFWPTNGSTDDVMIRLPEKFRHQADGVYSRDIYLLNLTILEAAIKNVETMSIPSMDEVELNIDLNQDAQLDTSVTSLKRPAYYLGQAADVKVNTFLYPEGTAFLHTVRYVGVDDNNAITIPQRMKEVRYMVKEIAHSKSMLGNFYAEEQRDKFEGNLPRYPTLGEKGVDNKFGWNIIGFIEAEDGELRPQVYEENLFCMGCHTTIGATIDQTFSFARKMDGAAGWGYIDLKGMPNVPVMGEDKGSITSYLEKVGGGNEFRANDEVQAKYFPDGVFDAEAVAAATDVYELITPSPERAHALNKAYKTIVEDQDYIYGRDANIAPFENVFKSIDTEVPPLEEQFRSGFDLRLDWSKAESP